MKTSSAKAKGRRLQKEVATRIQKTFDLPESDVRSNPMGAQGIDVWLSQRAQEVFPMSIECKNTERLNVWEALAQAQTNTSPGTIPLLVFSKNRSEVYAVLKFDDLLDIFKKQRG